LSEYPKKDYSEIFRKCVEDCHQWDVPISKKLKMEAGFIKGTDCYAICEALNNGYFQISYTTAGFDVYGVSKKAIYNLFMHELCHTIPGCFNHGREWKTWVKKLNEHGCKINPYPFSVKKTEYEGYY